MAETSPLVTIAIPTFNRAGSYLPSALRSALKQTYSNIEIVVSDNGSTDNTEQVVKGFSDERIRYYKHPANIGASNNFNFCVQQARGSFFLRFHDDDLIDQDFVETCLAAADYKSSVGIVRTGVRLIDSQGRVLANKANRVAGLSMEEFILGWFGGKTWPYLCNTLFNMQRLKEIGGFKSKHFLFDDVTAEMMLAAQFGRIDIESIKASSRVHAETRTCSAKVYEWCEDSLELLDLLCELAHDKKSVIRCKGMKFFAWICYHRARAMRSPLTRLSLYSVVYKTFEYHYSPIWFLIGSNPVYRKGRLLVQRTRNVVNGLVGTSLNRESEVGGPTRSGIMKVGILIDRYPCRSETFITHQITGLMNRGHDLQVFANKKGGGAVKNSIIQGCERTPQTFYVVDDAHWMPSRRLKRLLRACYLLAECWQHQRSGFIQLFNVVKYGRKAATLELFYKGLAMVKHRMPDLVHCHFGPNGHIAAALKEVGVIKGKIITTFYGYDLSTYIQQEGPHAYDLLFTRGDLFIAISQKMKEDLIQLGCPRRKIVVHKLGVDLQEFSFVPRKSNEDTIIRLLSVGRFVEKKGFEYGIRAVAQAAKTHPTIQYTIVGDGELREEFSELIDQLHMCEHIQLLGWKSPIEVRALMDQTDLFMAPSVTSRNGDQEGTPTVILEALARGLPVLSTLHSGIPELVQNGRSGFLVPEKNVSALAEKLECLVRHPEQWEDMGKAGRAWVEAHHDINQLNDQLIKIFEKVLCREVNGQETNNGKRRNTHGTQVITTLP